MIGSSEAFLVMGTVFKGDDDRKPPLQQIAQFLHKAAFGTQSHLMTLWAKFTVQITRNFLSLAQ